MAPLVGGASIPATQNNTNLLKPQIPDRWGIFALSLLVCFMGTSRHVCLHWPLCVILNSRLYKNLIATKDFPSSFHILLPVASVPSKTAFAVLDSGLYYKATHKLAVFSLSFSY